jgi:DNA mismatch repair protein MutL
MYEGIKEDASNLVDNSSSTELTPSLKPGWKEELIDEANEFIFQLHERYIVAQVKNGMMLIDQQGASERIIYEGYIRQFESSQASSSQQSLFPQVMELSPGDFSLLKDIAPDLKNLGFDLQEFGTNAFVIHGAPADIIHGEEKKIIEKIIEQFRNNQQQLKIDKRENIARTLSKSRSIKTGKKLDKKEMKQLIDELFACEKPYLGIDGKKTVLLLSNEEIKQMFR